MKKVIFTFFVAATILSSCGTSSTETVVAPVDSTAVDTVVIEKSISVDSVAVEADTTK